jgi:hypothetical protein
MKIEIEEVPERTCAICARLESDHPVTDGKGRGHGFLPTRQPVPADRAMVATVKVATTVTALKPTRARGRVLLTLPKNRRVIDVCAECGYVKGHEPACKQRPKPKKRSRADRWSDAAQIAVGALEELEEIRQEIEQWYDNLPENLQGSALGEKLETIKDMDVDGAKDTAQEALDAYFPRGWGRD